MFRLPLRWGLAFASRGKLALLDSFLFNARRDKQGCGGTTVCPDGGLHSPLKMNSTVGETQKLGGMNYTLTLTGSALSVEIDGTPDPDITKPVVSNVQASIITATNQNVTVTVTADFADDVAVASKLYRIGDGAWTDYADGVTVTENATVYFKAIDTSSNESEVVSYAVTNIDKIPPAEGKADPALRRYRDQWGPETHEPIPTVAAADAETAIKAFKPGKNFGEFIAQGKNGEFTLMPLFNVYHEHYSAYLPLAQ